MEIGAGYWEAWREGNCCQDVLNEKRKYKKSCVCAHTRTLQNKKMNMLTAENQERHPMQ